MKKILLSTCLVSFIACGTQALAQENTERSVPTLIVTNEPMASITPRTRSEATSPVSPIVSARMDEIDSQVYISPTRTEDIKPSQILNDDYYSAVNTMTAQKIKKIETEMLDLQGEIADSASQLQTLELVGQDLAANYYAAVATINTQLQSGTTPGNPRLKNRLISAEDALDTLSGNVSDLNKMAVQVADLASVSTFLQQEARAAYGLSGAVEEDHVRLAKLEDSLTNTSTAIQRLLNNVNDNITRASAYMTSERANLRTLALAISNGDLYGKSLSNRPFSMAGETNILDEIAAQGDASDMEVSGRSMKPEAPRPLVKIKFDRPNIDYTQALYMSVSEAMDKYPGSQFELVAVSPGLGNPAKLAIESTRARRNAEKVLRNMVQMGVDTNNVELANLIQDDLRYNEVHLYIR